MYEKYIIYVYKRYIFSHLHTTHKKKNGLNWKIWLDLRCKCIKSYRIIPLKCITVYWTAISFKEHLPDLTNSFICMQNNGEKFIASQLKLSRNIWN